MAKHCLFKYHIVLIHLSGQGYAADPWGAGKAGSSSSLERNFGGMYVHEHDEFSIF